jgi:hypothetical protein
MQSPQQLTLYDRLGGVYSIATVVDDLIDRVMADPRLMLIRWSRKPITGFAGGI